MKKFKEWCQQHDTLLISIGIAVLFFLIMLFSNLPIGSQYDEQIGQSDTSIARISNSIDIMSYQDYEQYNLNFAYIKNVPQTTLNGITYKVENGVLTLISGTATSNLFFTFSETTLVPFSVAPNLNKVVENGSISLIFERNGVPIYYPIIEPNLVYTKNDVGISYRTIVRVNVGTIVNNHSISLMAVQGIYDISNMPKFQPNLKYIYDNVYEQGFIEGNASIDNNYLSLLANITYGVTNGHPNIKNPNFTSVNFKSGFDITSNSIAPSQSQQSAVESAIEGVEERNNMFLFDFTSSGGLNINKYFYIGFSKISFGLSIVILDVLGNVIEINSADYNLNYFNSLDLRNFTNNNIQRIAIVSYTINSLDFVLISDNSYNAGYVEGYEKGEEDGQNNGYDIGYNDGQNDGYDIGYNKGYEQGADSGNIIGSALLSIADIPFSILSSFLGFEILGFNLLTLFTGLLTIGLVIFLLKKFF